MSHRRRDTLPRANRKPTAVKGPMQPRRISRREREAKQRRRLYIGVGMASALVVGILLFSSLNEYIFKPRAVVASVNGTDIRRSDYWKVRSVDLINQINQYQQFAQLVDASQQQQYITLAQQASDDLDNVWGSTDLDETTLNRMVEDQVYLQNMDSLGLEVTDTDVQTYIDTQFQPADAPLISPTPSPTLIPQRAEWGTQTIEAEMQEIDGTFTPTPVGDGSPVSDDLGELETTVAGGASPIATPISGQASPVDDEGVIGTPAARPESVSSPVGSGLAPATPAQGQIAASPIAAEPVGSPLSGTPSADDPFADMFASPMASPVLPEATVAAATPNPEQALQTAEAGYEAYQDGVFETAHLSDSDYRRLVARPAVAREKVRAALTADVGQTAEQVRAAHILVDTKDLADTIYASLQEPNANFEQTAIDQSNDTSTAPNGGDLGWFARGQMVDPFEQSAFTQAIGSISEPVQSEFGWHIIKVYERDPNRALSDQQIEQYRENIINDWLTQQRATMDISSDIEPSPTPGVSNFVPPADAPAVPTETPLPEPEPDASPVGEASPIVDAAPDSMATPVAEGSPVVEAPSDATPSAPASPVASPVAETTMPAIPLTEASPVVAPAAPSGDGSPVATPVSEGTPVSASTEAAMPLGSPTQPATPVIVPTSTLTATPSPTATSTPVATASPIAIASPMASAAASPVASPVASPIGSPSASPSP